VFEILCKYLFVHECKDDEDDDDSDSEDSDDGDDDAIPNPLLSTRAVCKSWKFSVDTFLQNLHHHYIGTDIMPNEQQNSNKFETINFIPIAPYEFIYSPRENKAEKFIARGFSQKSNPFINRYLKYEEYDDFLGANRVNRAPKPFRKSFTTLLELYGSYIWHAEFSLDGPSLEVSEKTDLEKFKLFKIYILIRRYLCLMPNLKTIYLSILST